MPFGYYQRLSARRKATYRKSDAVTEVVLPSPEEAVRAGELLRAALASGDRRRVQTAATALCARITGQLGIAPVEVRILTRRPSARGGELYGLYVKEEGKTAVIRLWMRTARQERVVAFRTFLRTLLHEVLHHLDLEHFRFAETFHTEGFFRRESSLVRRIAGTRTGAGTARGENGRPDDGPTRRASPPARRRPRKTSTGDQGPADGAGRAPERAAAPDRPPAVPPDAAASGAAPVAAPVQLSLFDPPVAPPSRPDPDRDAPDPVPGGRSPRRGIDGGRRGRPG